MDIGDLLTVPDAARELGVSGARVRHFIKEKRLPAQKLGEYWVIQREDLALVADRRTGRPPKHRHLPDHKPGEVRA
jgi:excisionase family DNA binding protein